jgi:hypothetical protein
LRINRIRASPTLAVSSCVEPSGAVNSSVFTAVAPHLLPPMPRSPTGAARSSKHEARWGDDCQHVTAEQARCCCCCCRCHSADTSKLLLPCWWMFMSWNKLHSSRCQAFDLLPPS